jgi:hypothetical protein
MLRRVPLYSQLEQTQSLVAYVICALLGYYAASSGNPLPTLEDGTDTLSRKVGKGLPLHAA